MHAPQGQQGKDGGSVNMKMLMDVPMEVTVEIGRARLPLEQLLALGPGQVIPLDKLAGEPLDIYVNGRLIGRGEAVAVGDKFGVRITSLHTPEDAPAKP